MIASFIATPVFAQKSRLTRQVKQTPTSETTRFGEVEAFSDGNGAWLRWQMDAERNNAGFYVYRIDKTGDRVISDMVRGSAFHVGDLPYNGETYTYFDPAGDLNAAYFIERHGMDGQRSRTSAFTPKYTNDLRSVSGMDSAEFGRQAEAATGNISQRTMTLPSDLKRETASNRLVSDINNHRAVISQPGVRIAARNAGLIRVTRTQLQNAGFNVSSDSNLWQLYLEGTERPIIVGPNGDYIEFFGKTLDTNESDIRIFYLIAGNSAGRRIDSRIMRRSTSSVIARNYYQTFVRRERTGYVNQVLNGDADNFWGRVISTNADLPTNFNFNLTGVDPTPGKRVVRVNFQGFSFAPHSIEMTLNGTTLAPATGNGRNAFAVQYAVPVGILLEGANTMRMRASGGTGDLSLFDSISIEYERTYLAENDRLDFYTYNYRGANVSGFSSPNLRVFDVTSEGETTLISNLDIVQTGSTFGPAIPAGRGRVYHIAGPSAFSAPISVTPNDPALLGIPSNAAQLVIIAHPSLLTQAQAWADYRISQGTSVRLINVDEIYDEFNFGTLSSFAIEDFLQYAKLNWQTPPSYVMLVGDGSFDSRNYLGAGYFNMVPSRLVNTLYTETGSDEALADFNNDGLADIAIGRIPSRIGSNVTNTLNKVIAWESALTPTSINRGAVFGFDEPNGYDFEGMSNRIMNQIPASMPRTTINRIGVTTPPVTPTTQVISAVNAGPYIVNYSGHGTASAWFGTSFFSSLNVPQLTNASSPAIFTSLTCLNGYFISNSTESFAEVLLRSSNGGAVAVWASSGLTTPDIQEIMATRFFSQIGPGQIPRIGDMIADAKMAVEGGGDVRLSWVLLGDPMLKIR